LRPQLALAVLALLGSACRPTPYRRALELRAQAEAAVGGGDVARANALAVQALDALGSDYVSEDTVDDTGLHLAPCADHERKGLLQDAYRCRSSVLEGRLSMCERDVRCKR
jgi:hypothetical protein